MTCNRNSSASVGFHAQTVEAAATAMQMATRTPPFSKRSQPSSQGNNPETSNPPIPDWRRGVTVFHEPDSPFPPVKVSVLCARALRRLLAHIRGYVWPQGLHRAGRGSGGIKIDPPPPRSVLSIIYSGPVDAMWTLLIDSSDSWTLDPYSPAQLWRPQVFIPPALLLAWLP